ncbi:MAG: zf-HC2 domain-containing protein [Myxococcales bacterium]|nr:zf-HC2 domain-containing protein [Myxococcales bacterium]
MTCREVVAILEASFDEGLTAESRADVEAHLFGCRACRREFQSYRRMLTALRDLAASVRFEEPEPLSEALIQRILAAAAR